MCSQAPESAPPERGRSPAVGEIRAGFLEEVPPELGVWDPFFTKHLLDQRVYVLS